VIRTRTAQIACLLGFGCSGDAPAVTSVSASTSTETTSSVGLSSSTMPTGQADTQTSSGDETSGGAVCGDGFVSGDEECDDGNNVDDDGCDPDCAHSRVVEIAIGTEHTCILTSRGRVKCWGENTWGQCGSASTDLIGADKVPSEIPWVDTGGTVIDISAGSRNTCSLSNEGEVRCWGYGDFGVNGQPGRPNIGDDEVPAIAAPIALGGVAVAIETGSRHACALLETGNVRCWGTNEDGALGYPGVPLVGDTLQPADVGDVDVGDTVVRVSTGRAVTCVLTAAQDVLCWGTNADGLGYGTGAVVGDDEAPASVGPLAFGEGGAGVSVGENHQCAVMLSGDVYCWGLGANGVLGYSNELNIGDDEPAASQGSVELGFSATSVVVGTEHTCALSPEGAVRCWGYNKFGSLGYGNTIDIGDDENPASAGPIQLDARVVQIGMGWGYSCGVSDSGDLWCWGQGGAKLGHGANESIGDNESPMNAGPVKVF
jgi:cysteine-rich repeat protein